MEGASLPVSRNYDQRSSSEPRSGAGSDLFCSKSVQGLGWDLARSRLMAFFPVPV